jgi:hypothetical protein
MELSGLLGADTPPGNLSGRSGGRRIAAWEYYHRYWQPPVSLRAIKPKPAASKSLGADVPQARVAALVAADTLLKVQ